MATIESKILPEHIATERPGVHPALDWREGVLMMGVTLADGSRAVLSSKREILSLDDLPFPTCDRSRNFGRSPVTEKVAKSLMDGYGLPEKAESAYALISVPAQLAAYYRKFVVFPEPWWPDVLALWTLGTYLYPIFNAYPYLRISSPEPGCGKSLLGELIAKLSFNGELMVSPTEANVFRMAEEERGTQVWDEVENQHEVEKSRLQTMTAVLLNGYRSSGAVPRQERRKGQFVTIRYHVYVPRVLIGLSELPAVVQQRTIELSLQRRSAEEQLERYRPQQQVAEEVDLREKCALWALTYCRNASYQYSRKKLLEYLEQRVGQAGRLTDDLLLPLAVVCAAPIDGDERSRKPLFSMLQTLLNASEALSRTWKEGATTTPQWLVATLDLLEQFVLVTPAKLAELVSARTGVPITAERFAHRLKHYNIRSVKKGGERVFEVSTEDLAQIRSRYNIAKADEPKLLLPPAGVPGLPEGQNGQFGQLEQQEGDSLTDRSLDGFSRESKGQPESL